MVNDRAEAASSDLTPLLVEQRGLSRVFALDPEGVRAAVARGLRPLPPVPSGPLTEPTLLFDASAWADTE